MNQNIIGLDIGTGTVKVATIHGTFSFPSIIAKGKSLELESKEMTLVGEDAVKAESIKSMVLKTPVYRGVPTSINDYLELITHGINKAMSMQKNPLQSTQKYSECIIVAGIPYSAKQYISKIKSAVMSTINPKFFGLMYQAKATLDNENMSAGIICHIGHGTTEIMVINHGSIAHAQTIPHGVGDITSVISNSKTSYLKWEIFSKNTTQLEEQRGILAAHISDALEKVILDYPGIPVICAGGGALVPRLIGEIKNDIIGTIKVASNPVFSNALGMLKKAKTYAN